MIKCLPVAVLLAAAAAHSAPVFVVAYPSWELDQKASKRTYNLVLRSGWLAALGVPKAGEKIKVLPLDGTPSFDLSILFGERYSEGEGAETVQMVSIELDLTRDHYLHTQMKQRRWFEHLERLPWESKPFAVALVYPAVDGARLTPAPKPELRKLKFPNPQVVVAVELPDGTALYESDAFLGHHNQLFCPNCRVRKDGKWVERVCPSPPEDDCTRVAALDYYHPSKSE